MGFAIEWDRGQPAGWNIEIFQKLIYHIQLTQILIPWLILSRMVVESSVCDQPVKS